MCLGGDGNILVEMKSIYVEWLCWCDGRRRRLSEPVSSYTEEWKIDGDIE